MALSSVAAATTEALTEVDAARPRRSLEELDRETSLADEELGRRDVDRPCGLEAADGVDAPGSQVAEREGEGAHHAQPVGDAAHRGRRGRDRVRRRSLEREDLDPVLRAGPSMAASFRNAPRPRSADPLLARAEVVDVAEMDVVHGRAVGDRDQRARRTGSHASR